MISYYPNMKDFNELFDKLVWYKEGDLETEYKIQAMYEVCYKIYLAGVEHGRQNERRSENADSI